MTKLDIVAVPFHDWKKSQKEGFRTRDVHLLQEIRAHPLVSSLLVVNRPISIAEMLVYRRPWRVRGGSSIHRDGWSVLTRFDEKLTILDVLHVEILRPLMLKRRWIPGAYGSPWMANAVRNALNYLGIENYLLWLFSPLPIPLFRELGYPNLVVDAVDNLTKNSLFTDMNIELSEYYDEIRQKASVIFTNSTAMQNWLSPGKNLVICIPNGVDPGHFANPITSSPDDLSRIPKPIVGYAGKMQELFDVELMKQVALALPNVSFVFIGQLLNKKWMESLWKMPNVYYLGDKHYDSLPAYYFGFDVCIIPYNPGRQHDGDPIKFYEYLAVNKPVVTTNIGEVKAFANLPHVKIVSNAEDFSAAINSFLEKKDAGVSLPIAPIPANALWSTKADLMIKTILRQG